MTQEHKDPEHKDIIKQLNGDIGMVTLISGTADGEDFWAYVSIAPDKYDAFLEAEKSGAYDVTEFGDILKYGTGTEPSAEDIQDMVNTYGIVPDMEERLKSFTQQILSRK